MLKTEKGDLTGTIQPSSLKTWPRWEDTDIRLYGSTDYYAKLFWETDSWWPKEEELTGGWWKCHNEMLNNFHYSRYSIRIIKSRKITWDGNLARMRRVFGWKTWNWSFGRSTFRWKDNIKMNFQKQDGRMWIYLALDEGKWQNLINALINFGVPWNAENFSNSWETVSV